MPSSLHRKWYATDLTDDQWELLAPLIPAASPKATFEVIARREIVNGIFYVVRTGCPWRLAPIEHDHKQLEAEYLKVRTMPEHLQKGLMEAIRLMWLAIISQVRTAILASLII